MVIREVLYAGGSSIQLTAGATTTLTANAPSSGIGLSGTAIPTVFDRAARSSMAWFEGRLWTGILRDVGGDVHLQPRRWDSVLDQWEASPDSATYTNSNANSSNVSSNPGLVSFSDAVHFFYCTSQAPLFGTLTTFNFQHALWQPDPGPNGASTTGTTLTFPSSGGYSKPGGGASATARVHHVVEHNGTLYVALSCGIMSATLTGGLTKLEELASSSAVSDMTAKSFGSFTPISGLKQLYLVDNEGPVKRVDPLSTVVDLTSINANITPGTRDTNASGNAPACVQVGSEFFVFMTDNVGAVMFKSSNPAGGSFTDDTATLSGGAAASWASNPDTHTMTQVDPSNDEVRVMFKDEATGQFEVFSFNGTTFTSLGSGTAVSANYAFFDPNAADVEIEDPVDLDTAVGTATIDYQIFRQVTASGTIEVEGEYSIDNGGTWASATATTGTSGTFGSPNPGSVTGLDASDSRTAGTGAPFTFVWDFQTDVGTGVFPNVRFRLRSV